MKINILSDMMCPFCYKRKPRLEAALAEFPHGSAQQINWHSFQLDPSLKTQPGRDLYEHLGEIKGQTRDRLVPLLKQITRTANEEGLSFNFDKEVFANSFNAHRLIQLAKIHDLAHVAEERLFKAHFTEGENIDDYETLLLLGVEIGLAATEIEQVLKSDHHAKEVQADEEMVQSLGVRGIPFFEIDEKYAISGAEPVETFLNTLGQAWRENEKIHQLATPYEPEASTSSVSGNLLGDYR